MEVKKVKEKNMEKKEFENMVHMIAQLDRTRIILVQNSAETLLLQQRMIEEK